MLRLMAYLWAAPVTLVGLALCVLALYRGRVSFVDGAIEATGPLLGWPLRRLVPLSGGAAAMTLGHVVIGVDGAALELTRSHERVHVRQYERWGLFFPAAYLIASAWAVMRGRHMYIDNHFERRARAPRARAVSRAGSRHKGSDLQAGRRGGPSGGT